MSPYNAVFIILSIILIISLFLYIVYAMGAINCERIYNQTGQYFAYNISLLRYDNGIVSCEEVMK